MWPYDVRTQQHSPKMFLFFSPQHVTLWRKDITIQAKYVFPRNVTLWRTDTTVQAKYVFPRNVTLWRTDPAVQPKYVVLQNVTLWRTDPNVQPKYVVLQNVTLWRTDPNVQPKYVVLQNVTLWRTDPTVQSDADIAETTLPVIGWMDIASIVAPGGRCLCAKRVTSSSFMTQCATLLWLQPPIVLYVPRSSLLWAVSK